MKKKLFFLIFNIKGTYPINTIKIDYLKYIFFKINKFCIGKV